MRKIHKLIPAITLALAGVETSAQVMYEPFDYSTTNGGGNANVTNSIANGGNSAAWGRTNPTQGIFWTRSGTAAPDHTITSGGLTSPAGLPDAIGNKASFTNTGNVDRIGFGQVFSSGRVYYSLLLKFDTLPVAASRVFGLNTFSLDAPGAATVLGSALTTRAQGGGYQVGVAKNTATAQFDSDIYSTSDTLFVVGAYEISGAVGSDDTSYMWVNPSVSDYGQTFGADPGPLADRLTDTVGADLHDAVGGSASPLRNAAVASFLLRANTTNSQWRVDEVRVDSTWAGVTPRKDLQYTWNDAGGGTFGDSTKWNNTGGPNPNPNSLGAVANFGSAITGAATITTAGQTFDTINIDTTNSLLINGTGLTVSTNASAGQLIAKRGSHTISAPLTLNNDLAIKVGADGFGANGATLTLSGSVTGASRTIGKYGLGTLKLGASNIIDDTATLAIRVGALDLNGNNETVGTVIVGAGHRNTGADLSTAANLAPGSITGAGSLTATTFQLENGSVSAVLAGSGAVIKTSQGAARVSGASTYTGNTTIRAGTLLVGGNAPNGAAGALGNSTSAILVSDAQTLTGTIDPGAAPKNGDPVSLLTDAAVTIGRNVLVGVEGYPTLGGNSAHTSTFSGSVTLNRATNLSAAAGGTTSFTGVIANGTGTGSVTKLGAGVVVLAGANTYSGGTTVNAGALVANSTGALPGWNVGGTVIANNGGTVAASAGGAGQWVSADIDTLQTTVTWNGGSSLGINVDASNSFTYASNITPSIGFHKLGAGTLTLSGTNNQTSTAVSGGVLHVTSESNLGPAPGSPTNNILLSGGGLLRFGAAFDPSNNRSIVLSSGEGGIDTNGNSVSTGATISGAGALVKAGASQLSIGGSNTYTGGTIIRGGTLTIFNDANLGNVAGPVTFDGGALKVFSTFSMTGRPISVTSNGGTFDTNSFNVDAAAVAGTGTLTKSSGGQLTATHVRTGGLTVGSGTVQARAQANPYEVASEAGTSKVTTLTASAGLIDLTNTKIITQDASMVATPVYDGVNDVYIYDGVHGLVQKGRGDGTWNGTSGMTTSQTDATTGVFTSLAVGTGAELRGLGPTDTELFAGQTVNGNSTVVMYTYGGDADMDGDLDGDDYFYLDSNVLQSETVFGWHQGDFNYDGRLNGDDYFILDSNILQAQASGNVFWVRPPEFGDGGLSAVPEPASIGLMGVAAVAGLRRRRR